MWKKTINILGAATLFASLFLIPSINEAQEQKPANSEVRSYPKDTYNKLGFTSVEQSLKNFKKVHNNGVSLPNDFEKKLPFKVTHSFGRMENDKSVRLEFLNPTSNDLLVLQISEEKEFFPKSDSEKVSKLKNGTTYFHNLDSKGVYTFRFKNDGLGYVLMADRNNHLELSDFENIATLITKQR
ncbi:hypothetical protein SAMN05192559_1223 [Halobacillus karajensis]|uniref:DUF4367 domain-containing protein n=1 Tax=Halobacillus karajensis TaxID=195088 RepID=A0A024P5S2_9BACI|nr:hypothetical protein [Halobacillus karajensis]CDQ20863.1 hypothetical protein BN982_03218 [Halobacillus karajensis]CDQ23667.1 hypothetical protein BN983_01918 [Halobacillus karajensis]CDQ27145.1 hypothetical protein BN981_01399 [Halobacillus karajensis]SEI14564.1 hypothetical protein SAMN05192559_1223 [Halobacillus karajensis]